MKINVVRVLNDEEGKVKALMLTRELSLDEKVENMRRYFNSIVKHNRQPYIREAKVFMPVNQDYIDTYNVKFGDNINSYDDVKHAIEVVETTFKEDLESEGLVPKEKINPSTKEVLYHNGKPIYRAVMLIALEDYKGDQLLKHDKVIKNQCINYYALDGDLFYD